MKVALYARVSTKDKQTNENQIINLKKYCENHNYQIVKIYEDKVSGTNWNRPALNQMLEDAWHRPFEKVLCARIDRFGRSSKDLLNTIEFLKSRGIGFECSDQPFDTSNAMGNFFMTVLGAVAQLERDIISGRVKDGYVRVKERAEREGKPLLWGRPKKELDEKEVLQLYEELSSTRKVAEKLGVSHVLVYLLLKKHPQILQRRKTQKMGVHNRVDKLTEIGGGVDGKD